MVRLSAIAEGWTATGETSKELVQWGPSSGWELSEDADFPRFWPYPKASAFHRIEFTDIIQPGGESLDYNYIASKLEAVLQQAGYSELSYYAVPEGFAILTRLEKINTDGSSLPEEERWLVGNTTNEKILFHRVF